jgi:hypothetical protein
MSEIIERVRQQIAESYRVCPPPCPVDERRRELAEERERQARKEREAEGKQQQEAAINSAAWYDAVDTRIHAHFKDWAWAAIDEHITQLIELHFFSGDLGVGGAVIGGLKDALGEMCAQLREKFKCGIEEQQRSFEAKFAEQKERLLAASNSTEEAQGRLREEVRQAIKEMCGEFGAQLAALEQRLKALPGRLPVAKLWQPDSVTYEAQVVSYDGSLYQACKDTAQAPGGSDWICVARAGRDGCDGQTPNFRGRHDAYQKYQQFDVIEFDGSSFVALYDNPGIPGDPGWQILSKNGSRGPVGERGERGRKGERGARGEDSLTIVSWTLDRKNYRAVPTMSNGQAGAPLDLRGLFEQYLIETSAATP